MTVILKSINNPECVIVRELERYQAGWYCPATEEFFFFDEWKREN